MYIQFSLGFHFGIRPLLVLFAIKICKKKCKKTFITFLFPAGSISGDIIDELMSSDGKQLKNLITNLIY